MTKGFLLKTAPLKSIPQFRNEFISILILLSYFCLDFQNSLLLECFATKILHAFFFSLVYVVCLSDPVSHLTELQHKQVPRYWMVQLIEAQRYKSEGRGFYSRWKYPSDNIMAEDRGGTVFKVLCYKSEGHWFDPSWCQWNFSLT